jgi:hypothetical protein
MLDINTRDRFLERLRVSDHLARKCESVLCIDDEQLRWQLDDMRVHRNGH